MDYLRAIFKFQGLASQVYTMGHSISRTYTLRTEAPACGRQTAETRESQALFTVPKDFAPELWSLVAEAFCQDNDPRPLLTLSRNHPLATAVARFLLFDVERPSDGKIGTLRVLGERHEFARLSMHVRHLFHQTIFSMHITFDEKEVNQKTEYLTEILCMLKNNSNTLSEIHLIYPSYLPSPRQAWELFSVVRELKVGTVQLLNHPEKYPLYRLLPHDSLADDFSDFRFEFFMRVASDITDLSIHQYSSYNEGYYENWFSETHYPRLKSLRLCGSPSYLLDIHKFLGRHPRIESLFIGEEWSNHPFSYGYRRSCRYPALTNSPPLHCPPKLAMTDRWACRFLEVFPAPVDLDTLYISPSCGSPPTKGYVCLEYIASVKHLHIRPQVIFHTQFLDFHDGTKYHRVNSLSIWPPDLTPFPAELPPSTESIQEPLLEYLIFTIGCFPSIISLALLWNITRPTDETFVDLSELVRALGWVESGDSDRKQSDMIEVIFGVGTEECKVLYSRCREADTESMSLKP